MKIMLVTPYFHPKIGGLETYAWNVANGLISEGHEVIVVTSNHSGRRKVKERVKDIRVIRLSPLFKLSNTPINPLWYFQLKKIIKTESPDVINAHSPVPFIADMAFATRGETQFVFTYHSGSLKKGKPVIDLALGLYERIVLRKILERANEVIAVYPQFLNKVLQGNRHINYIPPGIDTNTFKPGANRKTKDNTILYVGRIEHSSDWKGIATLIKAVEMAIRVKPDLILRVVGDGDAVDKHKALVEKLSLEKNIFFEGALNGEALVNAYQSADILVLPSETDAEAFGIVLIEAMSCGLPVIGSNIGGIPNVIAQNKSGLLVPPKAPQALAESIVRVLSDTNLSRALSSNGRRRVQRYFSIDRLTQMTNQVLVNVKENSK